MRRRPLMFSGTIACAAVFPILAAAQARYAVLDWAGSEFRRTLLVETAGLFWLGAEAAIFLGATLAVRILGERPLPDRILPNARERRYAWIMGIGLFVLAAFVYGRHLVVAPLPWAFASIGEAGGDIFGRAEAAYYVRAHTHATLWCGFIVAWMALEIAIVAQGVRAFYRLRGVMEAVDGAGGGGCDDG